MNEATNPDWHERCANIRAMARALIGTSGWVYKHWMGVFYPPKMPGNDQLLFYAERFPTVEVNFSFYRLPERSTFVSWRKRTPKDFCFAVKGSRFLTHIKRLDEPEEALERFVQRAEGLGPKLGPILFQFPASWPIHLESLEPFLEALQAYRERRFAFEFRHQSWLAPEVYRLLERSNAALCLPVHPSMPIDVRLTADWAYVRMHTGKRSVGYSGQELAAWKRRIQKFLRQGADVYVYFNNDPEGHAVRDAQRLRAMLEDAGREGVR
jgi:uncharacterized protein YecE (DUF72 family)